MNRKFAFNSLEYSLGLLTNEVKVKEQGKVLKQRAGAYRGNAVKFSESAPTPPPAVQNFDQTWKWLLDLLKWKPKGV